MQRRAESPANIGMEARFWSGEVQTRYLKGGPGVSLFGETPGSFGAEIGTWAKADCCRMQMSMATGMFASLAIPWRPMRFLLAHQLASESAESSGFR